MQRLRGSDAFAIYSETDTSPFVTFKVAIYEPTDPANPPSIAELKRFMLESVAVLGLTRASLRIMRVPLDLHHPVWVADPNFDPEEHFNQTTLAAPGGKQALCDFLSELAGMPLQADRPLWEIWLLDGLEHGRIAVVLKLHHALADGKTVSALIKETHLKHDQLPKGKQAIEGESIPSSARLMADAMIDLFKSYTVELPHYYQHLKQAREGSDALKQIEAEIEGESVAPFSAPWTILNQGGSPERLYRYESFSLSDFKKLAKHFDCTVNTMILGVCSEALRRYLQEVDEVPQTSLISAMPMGDQADSSPETLLGCGIHNNNLAVAAVPLFQNIMDFQERIQAIKRASRVAIDTVRRSNGRRFDNYLDFMPGTFVRLMNAALNRRSAKKQSSFANVVISNVPGPRETLYALDGRMKMVDLLSTGNITDAGSLNITVWSYVDRLNFSFYIRKYALPQPEKLMAYVREVVSELQQSDEEWKQLPGSITKPKASSGLGNSQYL